MDKSNMMFSSLRVLKIFVCFLIFLYSAFSSASLLHPLVIPSAAEHWNNTAINDFRLLNRRYLLQCQDPNPYLQISASPSSNLSDDGYVNVTVSGVIVPSHHHWIAMISPSGSKMESCVHAEVFYIQTGDTSFLPLLCHYPVKAEFVKDDPDYLRCKKRECQKRDAFGHCLRKTCSGTLTFHVINIRTDIEFVFMAHGFHAPCILARTGPIKFATPAKPLYGHLSSTDSTGTAMKLRWVSGDQKPQQVQFGDKFATSEVETFTPDDMSDVMGSPATDFGWHEPGFIHSAVMSELKPSTNVSYRYGSDAVGWSDEITFRTPPAAGSHEVRFLAFGDMGKAPFDSSAEHYIQPGSISVVEAMSDEIESGKVDSIFHIGDISYATGFLVEWDYFLHLITPLASRVPYMTAIGNHERDYPGSGSAYGLTDSGGECGVPYEAYFPMPSQGHDKPWYSIEQACVHFTVISTEHDWSENSEQHQWIQNDLASVDRSRTPWLVFTGHRPMYSTISFSVDQKLANGLEPLLVANKVDLGLYGHVHNYERTCTVLEGQCTSKPVKDQDGVDTYDHSNYTAPMHVVIGMAGFALDGFPIFTPEWSLARISKYGYLRVQATKQEMLLELVSSETREVVDKFRITK